MESKLTLSDPPSIPDHKLFCLIGRGSYGEIWLGRSLTGHWRAVKLVRKERFDDESSYLREFRGITRFEPISRDDPHFVDILHVGQSKDPDFFYFVMELADDASGKEFDPLNYRAKTLRKILGERKRFSVKETIELGLQLARGLEALHKHGLVHRDIKPSNIIFIRNEPKLADLGLVAMAGEGSYVGTEGYVAPEGPFTTRADLYSLGKVLYETFSGKDRLDFPELPTSVGGLGKDHFLAELNRVILKACASNPTSRYQTASELTLALEKITKQSPRPTKLVSCARILLICVPLALVAFAWPIFSPPEITIEPFGKQPAFLTSEPQEATVQRDGKVIGKTPLTLGRENEGPVELTFSYPGWEDQTAKLTDANSLHIRFAAGDLIIKTEPVGAIVEIDGHKIGLSPVTLNRLKPGKKELRIRKPGYLSINQPAEVRPEKTTLLDLTLLPAVRPTFSGPWTNSIGMKFVPVGDLHVCVDETRVRDFQIFADETRYEHSGPMQTIAADGQNVRGSTWKKPGFEQTPEHPVSGVSWKDAQAFCAWLTEKEREAGYLLSEEEYYRLPTDLEWSSFVALEHEKGVTPEARNGRVKNVYPWNGPFPPVSNRSGNYAGEEMKNGNWPAAWRVISGFHDAFTRTAPVESFPANALGLFDTGGNLWEWCSDNFSSSGDLRVLRGGSWANVESTLLLSSARIEDMIDSRTDVYGFRCVLETSPQASIDCVSSPDGAEVWINGIKKGITPMVLEKIAPGDLQIEFHLPGYLTERADYVVRARSHEKLRVELKPQAFPDFANAWTNSLGMDLVSINGLLFSTRETRVGDYRTFCAATGRRHENEDFEQGVDHPVVSVNRDEAQEFCAWLTNKEQGDGYLSDKMRYRLPTDREWSLAVGLEETGATPHARDSKVQNLYPWGTDWPPAKGTGNFAKVGGDAYKETSPVASFVSNKWGLYDLSGNVWEWCSDPYGGAGTFAKWGVLRGGSWSNYGARVLLSSYRNVVTPTDRDVVYGFRCVLENTAP